MLETFLAGGFNVHVFAKCLDVYYPFRYLCRNLKAACATPAFNYKLSTFTIFRSYFEIMVSIRNLVSSSSYKFSWQYYKCTVLFLLRMNWFYLSLCLHVRSTKHWTLWIAASILIYGLNSLLFTRIIANWTKANLWANYHEKCKFICSFFPSISYLHVVNDPNGCTAYSMIMACAQNLV